MDSNTSDSALKSLSLRISDEAMPPVGYLCQVTYIKRQCWKCTQWSHIFKN